MRGEKVTKKEIDKLVKALMLMDEGKGCQLTRQIKKLLK